MDVVIRSMYGTKKPGPKVSCGKSMAQQQFKDECDINNILRRYEDTGSWTGDLRIPTRQPLSGDFTDIPDLMTAQAMLIEGREAFDALPARLRKRFDNNPIDLLQFLSDPANRDECIELGLLAPDEEPVPEPKPRNLKVLPQDEPSDG